MALMQSNKDILCLVWWIGWWWLKERDLHATHIPLNQQMFLDFAPHYFNYLAQALFHKLPTVLCKVRNSFQLQSLARTWTTQFFAMSLPCRLFLFIIPTVSLGVWCVSSWLSWPFDWETIRGTGHHKTQNLIMYSVILSWAELSMYPRAGHLSLSLSLSLSLCIYIYMHSFLKEGLIMSRYQVVVMQNLWEGRTISTVFDLKV